MSKTQATVALEKRRDLLQPHVIQLSSSCWVSVAEDVSNVSMIVGKDGVVLIDTGMIPGCAERTLAKFRDITTLPIKTIIYTHGHGDHTGGSPVFYAEGSNPEIWARENFGVEAAPFEKAGLMPLFKARGGRQGGFLLPPEKRICNGVAPVRYPKAKGAIFSGKTGAVPPNRFFHGEHLTLKSAGIDLELYAAPGETEDALIVWFPAEKVLFAGDDIYRSFPNVYPVRGVGKRDIPDWCASLDFMLSLGAEAVVPGHTDPFIGAEASREALTCYRDALRFVYEKTIEGMNAGKTPDELARDVRLPEHLARMELLEEVYGNVAWTVRNIFSSLVGWYDGNPLHLVQEFGPEEEARRMAALAGGESALLSLGKKALEENDAAWAARIADHLLALSPAEPAYTMLKADALDRLAEGILTATGRNYAFTVARQMRQKLCQGA